MQYCVRYMSRYYFPWISYTLCIYFAVCIYLGENVSEQIIGSIIPYYFQIFINHNNQKSSHELGQKAIKYTQFTLFNTKRVISWIQVENRQILFTMYFILFALVMVHDGKETWSSCFQEVKCVRGDSYSKPTNVFLITHIVKSIIK